jgi:hypothetical protein
MTIYAAAEAVVRDSHKGAQPIVRKLRLFREAHERFSSRMSGAVTQIRQGTLALFETGDPAGCLAGSRLALSAFDHCHDISRFSHPTVSWPPAHASV